MTRNSREIRFFRRHIPTMRCIPGCHDCCGPITASSEEMARLPEKSEADRSAALAELNCSYLGAKGCEIYLERPLICRLFGTTAKLPCPHGRQPEQMIEPAIENRIFQYFADNRHRLL